MISNNVSKCRKCGGELKYYDKVIRISKQKGGTKEKIKIKRFRCVECNSVCRELPDYIYPFKHYNADIIDGVISGFITPETLGFEDYPCEMTMKRWAQK